MPRARAHQKPLSLVPPRSAWPQGWVQFPPCTHLSGQRGTHPMVPIYRLQLASSHGDFIVYRAPRLRVTNPTFPSTLPCLYITFYF